MRLNQAKWRKSRAWFLARHHYLHHLDTEANANFPLPLADWLFGTLRLPEPGADLLAAGRAMAPRAALAAAMASRRARSARMAS